MFNVLKVLLRCELWKDAVDTLQCGPLCVFDHLINKKQFKWTVNNNKLSLKIVDIAHFFLSYLWRDEYYLFLLRNKKVYIKGNRLL